MMPKKENAKRLPENNDLVLICERGGFLKIGYYAEGKWWSVQGYRNELVTHWMPLPKPPKDISPEEEKK